jgi:hypothetical protein
MVVEGPLLTRAKTCSCRLGAVLGLCALLVAGPNDGEPQRHTIVYGIGVR